MADYYPLIARAVDGLGASTGEARRALYERARAALVGQLRSIEPPLSEADITRERLALEDAIRKVEAETVRKSRTERPAVPPLRPGPPETSGSARSPGSTAARTDQSSFRQSASIVASRTACAAPLSSRAGLPHRDRNHRRCACKASPRRTPRRSQNHRQVRAAVLLSARTSPITREGLKGFRGVVNEVDDLGAASAQLGAIGARHPRFLRPAAAAAVRRR